MQFISILTKKKNLYFIIYYNRTVLNDKIFDIENNGQPTCEKFNKSDYYNEHPNKKKPF